MAKSELVSAINVETGECGEYIVNKHTDSQNFYKIFLADFLLALGILNVKSVDVVVQILKSVRQSDNIVIASQKEISEGAGTSEKTVARVMKKLLSVNFLKKQKNGVYIINPNFIMRGNENKRRMIINYYNDIDHHNKNDEPNE